MLINYILKGKKVVPIKNVLEWGRWMETESRIVKQDELPNGKFVSTVFLGVDYNFLPTGKPIVFETMVFSAKEVEREIFGKKRMMLGDELDMERYHTWEEAEKGHAKMVKRWSKKNGKSI